MILSGSQVVKESMRMYPVSASGLGRCTKEPTVIGGYLIPAGCEVQVNSTRLQPCPINSACDKCFGLWAE